MATRVNIRIPVRHSAEILTWGDDERQRIAEAAVEVLNEVGMRIDGEENLKMIEQAGGGVNWETNTVHFSEEEVLATVRQLAQDSPAPEGVELLTGQRPSGFHVGGGGVMWFDWDRWEAKVGTRQELRDLTRWAEGMEKVAGSEQFCQTQAADLHPTLQLVDSFAIMFQHSTKPVYFNQPTEPIHVKYMRRLQPLQEARGYHQDIAAFEWVNPPLTLGDRALKAMLARADAGVDKLGMGSMAMAGATTPVTAAGYTVMGIAEILGALAVVRRLRPQVGLQGAMAGGVVDMATGYVSYQSPRATVMDYLVQDVFRGVWKAHVGNYRGYRDANEPGMQACYEWALLNAFHRCVDGPMSSEIGGLANGNLFSPEQAVLDMEMEAELNEMMSGFEFSEEDLGLNVIMEARHDGKAYMEHPHTLKHFRDVLPFSNWWLRGLPTAAEHDLNRSQTQRLLDQAHQICVEARQRGEEVETNQELANEVWTVVADMAEELGSKVPEPVY